jgi:hypothetical protein
MHMWRSTFKYSHTHVLTYILFVANERQNRCLRND